MKIYYGPRGSGKTTELIKRSHKTKERILCLHDGVKQNVQDMAKQLQLDIPEPVTCADIKNHKLEGLTDVRLLVDNAEYILKYFIRPHVATITALSVNEDEPPQKLEVPSKTEQPKPTGEVTMSTKGTEVVVNRDTHEVSFKIAEKDIAASISRIKAIPTGAHMYLRLRLGDDRVTQICVLTEPEDTNIAIADLLQLYTCAVVLNSKVSVDICCADLGTINITGGPNVVKVI